MNIIRTGAAVAVVAVAASVAAPAAAAPSLRYSCASSTRDIDDTSYNGPWPDNWKVTVRTCAARSGGTVYAYAEARWDGPGFYSVDDSTIFDGAKLRLQIKQSRRGADAVVVERDFADIEARLEDSSSGGDYDGHYRTPTISHRAGNGALADSVLFLDWHGDGRGYQRHDYTASPTV
ncbi:hypothetical protein OG280_40995 (plasmid) [Streptomyces virginiae]|uniref:hypothetical protein n=1 Tax=Streptomyces virginiae TaxID=1961 RepID=UPI002DD970A6|nr:hypothetical protein [Streptomyces virginiae]WSC82728.1 hypothetical protein OHA56_41265 [Streptomyces virginiae]